MDCSTAVFSLEALFSFLFFRNRNTEEFCSESKALTNSYQKAWKLQKSWNLLFRSSECFSLLTLELFLKKHSSLRKHWRLIFKSPEGSFRKLQGFYLKVLKLFRSPTAKITIEGRLGALLIIIVCALMLFFERPEDFPSHTLKDSLQKPWTQLWIFAGCYLQLSGTTLRNF